MLTIWRTISARPHQHHSEREHRNMHKQDMSTNNDANNTKQKQKKKSSKAAERDEVEELLQAAEDEIFLKMSLNSHMARGSSSQFIDPDLDRRFQALKSKKPNTSNNDITSTRQNPIKATDEKVINHVNGGGGDDDDLFARFAALKSSLPSYQQKQQQQVEYHDGHGGGGDDDDDEDEVEKVIKWAMDAARLDPSPPSDTDDELQDDDDDGEDDDVVEKGKKGKRR